MADQRLLGSLYVTTPRAYLSLDHDSVRVQDEEGQSHRIPMMGIDSVVVISPRALSGALIERLTETGRALTLLDGRGVYVGRIVGPVSGNVLLRTAQYRAADGSQKLDIARSIVLAKLQSQRRLLRRRGRDARDEAKALLTEAVAAIGGAVEATALATTVDELRGHEGDAARRYFAVFDQMVTMGGGDFRLLSRERRPPRGRMNALLSFLYTLATHEAVAAIEAVGLDPQVGYLHALRPGRSALALDLVEEVRSPLCDRLALSLVNLRQLSCDEFEVSSGGATFLTKSGRRTVARAWADRRQAAVRHPLLHEDLPWGMVPHVQARLLARYLRGEMVTYPAFMAPE